MTLFYVKICFFFTKDIFVRKRLFYVKKLCFYKNIFCKKAAFLHKKAAFLQKYIFVRKLIFLCVKKRQRHKALYDFSRSTEELMQVFRYLDNYKTFVTKCATRCLEMPVNDDRGASRYWVRTIFLFIYFDFCIGW